MTLDIKKTDRHLYGQKQTPSIVAITEKIYVAVGGEGDPNCSPSYAEAISLLYGLAYGLKMAKNSLPPPSGYEDFVVPPLEGLWSVHDPTRAFTNGDLTDKDQLTWTSILRAPAFLTPEIMEQFRQRLRDRKAELSVERLYLLHLTEGDCVQVLHIGPYATEPESVAIMDAFAAANGYKTDLTGERRHHEIYLSDPRRVAPEKMKTILRHPIQPM